MIVKSFWQPPWLYALLFAGILPYLAIAPFFRRRFELLIPITADVLAAHQRRTAIAAGVTVLSLAALYALFLSQYQGVWLAHLVWLLVIAGVTGFFISSSPPVRLRIDRLDETVWYCGIYQPVVWRDSPLPTRQARVGG